MRLSYRAALVIVCTGPQDRPHRYILLDEVVWGLANSGGPLPGLHVKHHHQIRMSSAPADPLAYVPRRGELQLLRFQCPRCRASAQWNHDRLTEMCRRIEAAYRDHEISEPRQVVDLSVRRSFGA